MIVFGGTFDPIHNGHLHCANKVQALFAGRELRMMLAARPNLKSTPVASVADRWKMLELACESYVHLVPDDTELQEDRLSTTARTALELGGTKDEPILWILGSDAAEQLPKWQDQHMLRESVSFIVVQRPKHDWPGKIDGFLAAGSPEHLQEQAGRYWICKEKMLDLSSTEIRRQAFAGMYVNGLVPYSVYVYIRSKSLYFDNESALT